MMKRLFLRLKGIIGNLTAGLRGFHLAYVVETHDWSIKQDGESITRALNQQRLLKARITYCPCLLKNHIIHFGSINTFFTKHGWNRPHPSNRVILTWFHILDGDPRVKRLAEVQGELHAIHTSCESTKRTLVEGGIDPQKIVVIPLGVDLDLFKRVTETSRRAMRERLNVPQDRFVIGSFQKDGVGWGEGLEPKLEKGPDVFVETVAKLKHLDPFVLLTGPSRGYVMRELRTRGIEYKHIYPKQFAELPSIYHALDVYLIASRVEGGPKALLEGWASGVPVVSTRVGMVPDIARDGETVLLADVEDANTLANLIERLHGDPTLAKQLTTQARGEVASYLWNTIARRYQENLYRLPYESLPTR